MRDLRIKTSAILKTILDVALGCLAGESQTYKHNKRDTWGMQNLRVIQAIFTVIWVVIYKSDIPLLNGIRRQGETDYLEGVLRDQNKATKTKLGDIKHCHLGAHIWFYTSWFIEQTPHYTPWFCLVRVCICSTIFCSSSPEGGLVLPSVRSAFCSNSLFSDSRHLIRLS